MRRGGQVVRGGVAGVAARAVLHAAPAHDRPAVAGDSDRASLSTLSLCLSRTHASVRERKRRTFRICLRIAPPRAPRSLQARRRANVTYLANTAAVG